MAHAPPIADTWYRRFLDGRGDSIESLLFFLRGDRDARAETRAWAALTIAKIFLLRGRLPLSRAYLRLVGRYFHADGRALPLEALLVGAAYLEIRGSGAAARRYLRAAVRRDLRGEGSADAVPVLARETAAQTPGGSGSGSYDIRLGASSPSALDDSFLTRTPAVAALLDEARRGAALPVPVLILGESGTGKEVLARSIHRWSDRAEEPFIPVNVAALPEALFEGILFGHERGAFTGAVARRAGLIETAAGGTIFLDEIGELPSGLQAKLLRLVERGEYLPLGSGSVKRCRACLIAATNRDPAAGCAAGTFRQDLYYRLAVLSFTIPPLRERPADIPLLAEHFLAKACVRCDLGPLRLGEGIVRILLRHPWPGNARELESEMLRSALRARRGVVRMHHLSSPIWRSALSPGESQASLAGGGGDLTDRTQAFERAGIVEALAAAGGNRSEAARRLGLKRTTLLSKMKRYNL